MRTDDFDYDLPANLIAHYPAPARDGSRLLVLERSKNLLEHRNFSDLPSFLRPGDLLVLNNSKVIPARLRAKKETGSQIEVLLTEEVDTNIWWSMLKPGKRVRPGTRLHLLDHSSNATPVIATVQEKSNEGHFRLFFTGVNDIKTVLDELGELPLPPYIHRPTGPATHDLDRYQTVFAKPLGSVAAPTAGLHFTPLLLEQLRRKGIATAEVTLHVGLGTFMPVKAESLAEHRMHEERYEVPASAADAIRSAKARGGRVIAVGTTSLRVLESVAAKSGDFIAGAGRTRLFVYPPYQFKVVDALLTNFHLPKSTLLMLVSAFASPAETAGIERIRNAYQEAVREQYRFFSYGDAMLIL